MPFISGMFQSESTRSGASLCTRSKRLLAVLGLDDVVAGVPGLAEGADHDLAHHAAVVGDEDLHGGVPSG